MKILFVGDSLIAFYDWRRRFPEYTVFNHGVAGETVGGLLASLAGHLASVDDIDVIHLMIGTNNIVMNDYAFLAEYEDILELLAERAPRAKVVVASLLPLQLPWLAPDTVSRLNVLLRQTALRYSADYLNIYDEFMKGTDSGSDFFADDGVHITDKGYGVWALKLERYLKGR